MTMEYLDEYDSKSNIFIQHLDSPSILSLDNTSMEIRCLKDKENEFYVCGDALIGIVDKKITKPKNEALDLSFPFLVSKLFYQLYLRRYEGFKF